MSIFGTSLPLLFPSILLQTPGPLFLVHPICAPDSQGFELPGRWVRHLLTRTLCSVVPFYALFRAGDFGFWLALDCRDQLGSKVMGKLAPAVIFPSLTPRTFVWELTSRVMVILYTRRLAKGFVGGLRVI